MPKDAMLQPKRYQRGAKLLALTMDRIALEFSATGRIPSVTQLQASLGLKSRTHARYYLTIMRDAGLLINPRWGEWLPGPAFEAWLADRVRM